MATTISRPTLTDDSGTPASPVGDGTLIDAAFWTAHLDAIDALATSPFTHDGLMTWQAAGTHTITGTGGGGGQQGLSMKNTGANADDHCTLRLENDALWVWELRVNSSAFTETNYYKQNGMTLIGPSSNGAGGITIATRDASGDIRLIARDQSSTPIVYDGTTLTIDGSTGGKLTVGGTGTSGVFSANGAGAVAIQVENTGSGTADLARLFIGNDTSGSLVRFDLHGSGYTESNSRKRDGLLIDNQGAGGIRIQANHASGVVNLHAAANATATIGLDAVPTINFNTSVRWAADAGVISPTALAANTNDWNPTGLATAAVIRASATGAARDLTGIVAQPDGFLVLFVNVGSLDIVLKHSTTSTAANQFACPQGLDVTVDANDSIWIWYDGSTNRWRPITTV